METSYDKVAIECVRETVDKLRKLALSQIPDLDKAAPPDDWTQEDGGQSAWERAARKRVGEAIDWRDALLNLIGSIDDGHCWVTDASGKSALVQNRETLLGQFHTEVPDGTDHSIGYIPGSHPIIHLGNARLYLGPPPHHLVYPPFFEKLTKRTGWSNDEDADYAIGREDWGDYSEIILHQCLLVRTRALELCAWCAERIRAWESAWYPTIYIGPERPKGTKGSRNRTLRVEMAGGRLALPRDTIPNADAERLLSLRDGATVTFEHRSYATRLTKLIPPLSGLLRSDKSNTLGARYRLPREVKIEPERDNTNEH